MFLSIVKQRQNLSFLFFSKKYVPLSYVHCTRCNVQVEEKDTAQSRAELEMYGSEDELTADYWRDLAEKR